VNLSDITAGEFLAANDYSVGTTFPLREIVSLQMKDVATPGKTAKQSKCVIFLNGVPKGWVVNKQVARQIGAAIGCTTSIEKGWVGARVALTIVGDVRRPDGTRGNAIRVSDIQPAIKPTEPTKKETTA
jgi:hypothetical protein